MVVETAELIAELRTSLYHAGAVEAFHSPASFAPFEAAVAMEKHAPEILFVEFSWITVSPTDWMQTVCTGTTPPLVVAVHMAPDAGQMITALRSGAIDFLTLPLGAAATESFE